MTVPTTLSPEDVLRATADYFEQDTARWGQEWLLDRRTGCRCALGGIAFVVDPDDLDADPFHLHDGGDVAEDAVHLLRAYLLAEGIASAELPSAFHVVGGWNDEPGRTVHEVIGTLRAAARWSEERAAVPA